MLIHYNNIIYIICRYNIRLISGALLGVGGGGGGGAKQIKNKDLNTNFFVKSKCVFHISTYSEQNSKVILLIIVLKFLLK